MLSNGLITGDGPGAALSSSAIRGFGNVSSGTTTTANALSAAERYLGSGYNEIAPGVFRSADNLRQFRMTTLDILDARPHAHFESIAIDGRTILENGHLYLSDP